MKTQPVIEESTLIRYFSGEVTAEEKTHIEKWIRHSDENKKIAKQVYYIYFATDTLQTMETVNSIKALSYVSRKIKKTPLPWKKRIQQIAAILFIPLFLSTLYFAISSSREQQIRYIEVRTNPGMITSITLPDDTKVWLNSETYLKYPSEFNENSREVELIGEAYFEVEKDTDRKFLVKTPDNVEVEVLGTEFNVEAYKNQNVVTTLVSGKVNLSYMGINNKKNDLLMSPNQKVIYDMVTKTTHLQHVRVEPDIAWKDGKIILSDTALEEALKILSKRFNVDFIIKNEKVKDNHFTGTFVKQRLDVILEHFNVASGIRFRYIETKNKDIPEKNQIEVY